MPTEEQDVEEDTGLKHLLLALKAQDTTIESDLLLEIISSLILRHTSLTKQ